MELYYDFLCNNYLEEKKPLLHEEEEALKFCNKYFFDDQII
jgi:hypothetical protein